MIALWLHATPTGSPVLWDVETGALLRSFRTNHKRIWAAAFSPDGRKLATCGTDGRG